MTYTTRATKAPNTRKTLKNFMTPSRIEHQSKHVESVIFEPQPRIMLSRSTYKITSFVDFTPYKLAFTKFATYLRKFRYEVNSPSFIGFLYNENRTESGSWHGPREEHFRGCYEKSSSTKTAQPSREIEDNYNCTLVRQFMQIRKETIQIKKLYQQIHAKFNHAIDNMKYHPTSETQHTEQNRAKRNAKLKTRFTGQQYELKEYLDIENGHEIRDAIDAFDQMLGNKITKPRRKK